MKKGVLIALIFAMLIMGFVGFVNSADEDTTTATPSIDSETAKIDKAYSCLKSQIGNKTALSLQEAIFSTLAVGWSDKVNNTLEGEKKTNCWPRSGCKLKETSQAMLAYNRIGKNTDDIEKWLISQNMSITELNWFIEIDTSNKVSSCTLNYGSQSTKVEIGSDMKLSSTGGNCLSISSNGYWLAVARGLGCLDKDYSITCNQDFITTTLYQKSAGATVFVSAETHSATAGGFTSEKLGGKCFRTGSSCDYEGSLWAAVALKKVGYDVSAFIPYILSLAEDNTRYFPSAFVYLLTERQDMYGNIVQSQKQGRYWEITSSPYNKYYDSALGMLALIGTESAEISNAKEYFLNVQTPQGCWNNNNIRDTAFLLYAGWQRDVQFYGGGGGTNEVFCQDVGKYCETPETCITAGGQSSAETCPGFGETVCCSAKAIEETCLQKNGIVCQPDETCSLAPLSSADGDCCLGRCEATPEWPTTITQCEENYGTCKSTCDTGEDLSSESCNDNLLCCKTSSTSAEGGLGWWWLVIILLILLITLAVLGIIYRDKVRVWWMRYRKKAEIKPLIRPGMSMPGRPPFGRPMGAPFGTRPLAGQGMMPARPAVNPAMRPAPVMRPMNPATPAVARPVLKPAVSPTKPVMTTKTTTTVKTMTKPVAKSTKAKSKKDKDFEETLRKLKDMSK
ncbi:MAG: hypothetical protein Q8L29_02370 [archaeon]|nr:hypothetical protein [archaeon]